MRYLTPILLLTSSLCLAFGLVLPLIRMDRLYFFSQSPSLIEIVGGLWADGEFALSLLVGLFSVAFPIAKLAVLHILAFGRASRDATRAPRWLKTLGRLSMVDVLLVALVIFAAKTSGLATALTQPGLWFFTASALLSTVALNRLK